jgi:glutamine---fructose-6-phosphate transaminase (isomerizing)
LIRQASSVDGEPGSRFLEEIREQPGALERLAAAAPGLEEIAARVQGARFVRLVGHGSSDNAASYGVYAFPLLSGLTAFRESISLLTYYEVASDLRESVVVAISQSGRTPDVVEYFEAARGRAALTVALTNEPDSPLAEAADAVVPLCAGVERAVAATKTYTTSVAALALLAGALGGRARQTADAVNSTASLLAECIPSLAAEVAGTAALLRAASQLVVIGRGVEFATAREIALKLSETCALLAEPLTSTDLAHGPIAGIGPHTPVWVVASNDPCLPAALEAAGRARGAGAPLIASGDAARAVSGAGIRLPVPSAPESMLAPLLSVVPGQLFAWALALAKGLDPDSPVGLSKVTVVP